jgi:hypothetical protein
MKAKKNSGSGGGGIMITSVYKNNLDGIVIAKYIPPANGEKNRG